MPHLGTQIDLPFTKSMGNIWREMKKGALKKGTATSCPSQVRQDLSQDTQAVPQTGH